MEVSILPDVEWDPQLDYERNQIGITIRKDIICGYCQTIMEEVSVGRYQCNQCKRAIDTKRLEGEVYERNYQE